MIALRNLAVALLAVPFAAALPAAEVSAASASSEAPFSFEAWAIALAAGEDTLSVEEAIEAANSTREADSLEKRWQCNHLQMRPAHVPDAVACINQLARNGRMCRAVIEPTSQCKIGRAEIIGIKGGTNAPFTESTCEHVARAAGIVMDNCWRADNTVQGMEKAWGNGNFAVHITSAP